MRWGMIVLFERGQLPIAGTDRHAGEQIVAILSGKIPAASAGAFPAGSGKEWDEPGKMIGASGRTGRTVLQRAIAEGLRTSGSEKTLVRLAFPVSAIEAYLPRLFAPGGYAPAIIRNQIIYGLKN